MYSVELHLAEAAAAIIEGIEKLGLVVSAKKNRITGQADAVQAVLRNLRANGHDAPGTRKCET